MQGQDPTGGQPDLEDRTLMREIQFLGAVIAEVANRPNHLSPEEVDQVLERAAAIVRRSTRPQ